MISSKWLKSETNEPFGDRWFWKIDKQSFPRHSVDGLILEYLWNIETPFYQRILTKMEYYSTNLLYIWDWWINNLWVYRHRIVLNWVLGTLVLGYILHFPIIKNNNNRNCYEREELRKWLKKVNLVDNSVGAAGYWLSTTIISSMPQNDDGGSNNYVVCTLYAIFQIHCR